MPQNNKKKMIMIVKENKNDQAGKLWVVVLMKALLF